MGFCLISIFPPICRTWEISPPFLPQFFPSFWEISKTIVSHLFLGLKWILVPPLFPIFPTTLIYRVYLNHNAFISRSERGREDGKKGGIMIVKCVRNLSIVVAVAVGVSGCSRGNPGDAAAVGFFPAYPCVTCDDGARYCSDAVKRC